jgi:predicted secreted protein
MIVMLRFLSTIIFGLLIANTAAKAGDFAQFRSLGFSKDGSVFAFEQFGIQDGSGFPYAERYFIHTKTDTFVKPSPFKIRLDDENASMSDARDIVANASAALMAQYDIGAVPAIIAAFNPSTEVSSNGSQLSYQPFAYEPNSNDPYQLMLKTYPLPAKGICADMQDQAIGFELQLKTASDALPVTLHQDATVPKSRYCPVDYRVGGVLIYDNFGQKSIHVALVLVKSLGFEGPDGRWIAIPHRINQ